MRYRFPVLLLTGLLLSALSQSQTQPQQQTPPQPPEKKPEYVRPTARLAAAKTAFVQKTAGSAIPFDVISSSLEGWGRFTLVSAPDKADIIIEVSSPEENGSTTLSTSTKPSRETGRPEQSWSNSHQLPSGGDVKLIVRDSKTKVPLWIANERAKTAMKKVDRENNLVEAAQRLVERFHDQLEPPNPK